MLWLLFVLLALVAVIIASLLPLNAGIGYLVVLAWTILLIYLVFYSKDEIAYKIEKILKEVKSNGRDG